MIENTILACGRRKGSEQGNWTINMDVQMREHSVAIALCKTKRRRRTQQILAPIIQAAGQKRRKSAHDAAAAIARAIKKPFARLIVSAESQILAPSLSHRFARSTRLLDDAHSFVSRRIHFFSLDGQNFWPIFPAFSFVSNMQNLPTSAPHAARSATRAANRSPTLRTVRFMRSSSVGAQARRSSPPTSNDEAAIIDISMIEQENARESPASTPRLVASRLERHPRALGRSPPSSSLPPQANAQLASDVAAANSSSSSGATAARRRHSRTIVEPLAASSTFAALRRRRPSQRQLTYGCIAILALNALLFVALIIVICINGRRSSTSQRFVHFELATVLQSSRRAFALFAPFSLSTPRPLPSPSPSQTAQSLPTPANK